MAVGVPRALLALAAGLTVGVVAVGSAGRLPRPAPVADAPTVHTHAADGALAVLHAWDVRRAAAWATGDPDALARLYTARSAAGAADLAMLRRYTDRGLVVRDLRTQLLRARILTIRPRRLELEVTDRLAGAVAVRAGEPRSARRLPATAPSTHLLVLRRPAEDWVVARVSAAPGR